MAAYEVYVSDEGSPVTGAILAWESLEQRDNGGAEGSQPDFSDIGGGWYTFSYTPTETMLGVIDCDSNAAIGLSSADRYVPCKFTPSDEALATIDSNVDDVVLSLATIDSNVDDVVLSLATIDSNVDIILPALVTIDSVLDSAILALATIDSAVDANALALITIDDNVDLSILALATIDSNVDNVVIPALADVILSLLTIDSNVDDVVLSLATIDNIIDTMLLSLVTIDSNIDSVKELTDASKGTDNKVLISTNMQDLSSGLSVNAKTLTSTLGLTTQMKADVNAQVVDVVNVDTIPELSSIPTATPTIKQALMMLYMALRNKGTSTSVTRKLFNNAGTEVGSAIVSDDGTTFTKEKFS